MRMMRAGFLLTVCAALLPGAAAHAQIPDTGAVPIISDSKTQSTNLIDNTWNGTPPPATPDAHNAVADLRGGMPGPIVVDNQAPDLRVSAKSMLNADVHSANNGESIAAVQDVIIDQYGNPQSIILRSNGTISTASQLVSFDFKTLVDPTQPGAVIKPLDESALKNAPSYTPVADNDHISAASIMGATINNDTGLPMAKVENLVFDPSAEPYMLLSYTKPRSIGAALVKFKDVQKSFNATGGVELSLTKAQADFFQTVINGK